jgi:alcohol dehydrogenase (cytochrome c)
MMRMDNVKAVVAAAAFTVITFVYTNLAQAPPPPAAPPQQQQAPAGPMPPVLRNYQPVTWDRLKNPEADNWLMIRRTYDGWGYSPLNQIATQNVSRLRPVWGFSTGETKVHESAPIVNNGVMFVSTPNNQVIAIDAKTGNVLWRYRRTRPAGTSVPHDTNRGVALYSDKVYYAAGEAILVALDAKTGKEVWTTTVADNKSGYYISLAPLAASGKIMVGASGGEFGIRGFVAAYDPDTGKELWRTFTIPAPGEPGSETWPKGDQWKTGGAPVWVTGNYDPETNLAYWGTGNGGLGLAISGRAITSIRLRRSRLMSRRDRSRAITSIIRTTHGTGTKCRRQSWWITGAAGAQSKASSTSRAMVTCGFWNGAAVRSGTLRASRT